MRRVVVTGIGMINALGLSREDSFKAIVDGRCGVKTISSFDVSEFPVKIAAEITNFDPSSVMEKSKKPTALSSLESKLPKRQWRIADY